MTHSTKTIGVIGCGNIGEAIIKNMKAKPSGRRFLGADKDAGKRRRMKNKYRIRVTSDNRKLAGISDVIILAVKPQDAKKLLLEISGSLSSQKLVISVMAGITRGFIKKVLRKGIPVVRVMPNIPALIGEGVSAVCSSGVSRRQREEARRIFLSLGEVVEIREADFDAITAISGSGPAYFFYLVEVLIKAAVSLGLKKDKALKLAVKTAQGSTQLLSQLKIAPHILRSNVTSKGGTTEAAFNLFQKRKLGKILEEGIRKARDRSSELRRG